MRVQLFKYKISKLQIFILFLFIFTGCIRSEKTISGNVLDCETNEPIPNAEISINQRGWGRSPATNEVVWDKDYIITSQSDDSGYYEISYKVGSSAHIRAKKEGYIKAEQFEYPGQEINIRMLRGNKLTEATYNCKLSSECLFCENIDGVETCRNICI